MTGGRRAAIVLAAAALALGGCGGSKPEPTPDPRPPGDEELLRSLLFERVDALARGDARRFAATSHPALRARDRRVPDRLRRLGVRIGRHGVGATLVRGERALVRAGLSYRVDGVDGTFSERFTMRARRTGGGWLVGGLPATTLPWEAGEFARRESPHFVIWVPEGTKAAASTIERLEASYEAMGELLPATRLRDRYLVLAVRNPAQARLLAGRSEGFDHTVALASSQTVVAPVSGRVQDVTAQSLMVILSNFAAEGRRGQLVTGTHELTHAALAPTTSSRTPGWLIEGVALYVSRDDRSDQAAFLLGSSLPLAGGVRRALTLRGLSHPRALGRLSGPAAGAAYAYSSAAAFYLVDRYGRQALFDLIDVYNRIGLVGEAGDADLTDAALREALGVPLARFERELRAWIARKR